MPRALAVGVRVWEVRSTPSIHVFEWLYLTSWNSSGYGRFSSWPWTETSSQRRMLETRQPSTMPCFAPPSPWCRSSIYSPHPLTRTGPIIQSSWSWWMFSMLSSSWPVVLLLQPGWSAIAVAIRCVFAYSHVFASPLTYTIAVVSLEKQHHQWLHPPQDATMPRSAGRNGFPLVRLVRVYRVNRPVVLGGEQVPRHHSAQPFCSSQPGSDASWHGPGLISLPFFFF